MSAFTRLQAVICQRSIDQLMKDNPGIFLAVVATTDGFEVVSAPVRVDEGGEASRLAAMSSSMLALAEAMVREADLSICNDVLVDCAAGRLLLLSVPVSDARFVLCVGARGDTTLGHVLAAGRLCAEEMSKRLQLS